LFDPVGKQGDRGGNPGENVLGFRAGFVYNMRVKLKVQGIA